MCLPVYKSGIFLFVCLFFTDKPFIFMVIQNFVTIHQYIFNIFWEIFQAMSYTKSEIKCQQFSHVRPHGLQLARLLCPWNSSGKNTGVDCHFLILLVMSYITIILKNRQMLGPKILSEMLIPNKSLWLYTVLPLQLKCVLFLFLGKKSGISILFYCQYKYIDFSNILQYTHILKFLRLY